MRKFNNSNLESFEYISQNFGFKVFDNFDSNGQHALHYAAMNKDPRVFVYLATHGAYKDIEKVRIALKNQETGVVKMDICVRDKRSEGFSPLHHAVMCGDLRMIETLLYVGIPIDITDNHLRTPLITAARVKNQYVVMYLVSHGADIYAEDEELDNSLHWAAYNGLVKFIKR